MSEEFTKVDKSLILYLETCMVDKYGLVKGAQINNEDIESSRKLESLGVISLRRLPYSAIGYQEQAPFGPYTYYIENFSSKAWDLAHQFRMERSKRMIESEDSLYKKLVNMPRSRR